MYTAFGDRYRSYSVKNKATMHIERRPGEQMEVDWAGGTMEITDNLSDEIITAYIFVATLNYSGYVYVEGFLSREQENWIAAQVVVAAVPNKFQSLLAAGSCDLNNHIVVGDYVK